MLLASVSLFIFGKVVHFRQMRIWPWVFDCFPCVAVHREACSITSAFNRTSTARFSDKEISPPAIWNMPILWTAANPLHNWVWLAVSARRLRVRGYGRSNGAALAEPCEEAGRLPPRSGQKSSSLRWAGEQGAPQSSEQTDWACS